MADLGLLDDRGAALMGEDGGGSCPLRMGEPRHARDARCFEAADLFGVAQRELDVWHERQLRDPGSRWLRELISAMFLDH
jgi:hypothetical protein